LNAEHYIAIQHLSLPKKGGKTDEEIAELAGVSRQSIYNWRKDPLFETTLYRQILRNMAGDNVE
jgi:transcriptional regulator with XRE-family HTH domain